MNKKIIRFIGGRQMKKQKNKREEDIFQMIILRNGDLIKLDTKTIKQNYPELEELLNYL
jgi:hypothetical protein